MGVFGERSTQKEIAEFFTFSVPGHQFMPMFRNKMWDGKIRLYDVNNFTLFAGLLPHLEKFAADRNYTINYVDDIGSTTEFSLSEADEFLKSLKLPFEPYDFQVIAFAHAVRKSRALILSPTGSGKSLIIYSILRYFAGKKILIIVPTKSLVAQLYGDFDEYAVNTDWRALDNCHQIMQGREKQTDLPVVISTWQSIFKMPRSYFDQYDVVIGDECHQFKSKSLQAIMTKLTKASIRIGTTGTLDDSLTHKLVLEGLFGRTKKVRSTKQLMDDGILAKLTIKALVLKHSDAQCKLVAGMKYQDEIEYLLANDKRNRFIRNLAVSLKGNTLVLFNYVEKHGHILAKMITEKVAKGRPVYYVWGKTDVEAREEVRRLVEMQTNAIIVASSGVFSTGINIKNLHNIIFAHPGKSKIRTLQSIGRSLRVTEEKTTATLYDIVDDLIHCSKKNWAVRHFVERHKMYMEEEFTTKIYKVKLN